MPKVLTKQELETRFNNHFKMSRLQLEELFPGYDFTREQMRFLEKGIRNVTTFDIEAINFDARLGFIICWYALRWDVLTNKKEMIYDQIEKKDMKEQYKKKKFNFDTRILQTLSEEIKRCDMLVGHYISKYDVPYFSMRCHLTGQDELVPEYGDCKMVDTWRITKQKYNMWNSGGNSLRNAGRVIAGYDDKTSVDLDKWLTMYYASNPDWNKCRKYITDHCEIDVYQNFEVFKKEIKRVPIGGASI